MAKALNLTVNSKYGYNKWVGGNQKAAQVMIDIVKANVGTTILTAWEHVNIQYLVEAMGVDKSKVPNWSGSDYDTVYIMTFTSEGTLASFDISHENFTP